MENWRSWFVILFALFFGYLWWRFAGKQHNDIRKGDEIGLHPVFQHVFGKPNENGVYNIRGIYSQLFISLLVVTSVFYNASLISILQYSQILLVGIFSFPVLELIRFSIKRLTRT